jgi:hypothetical protein
MKRLTQGLFCVVIVSLLASVSTAATPRVTVYFDEAMTIRSVDRLNPGQHTLYVAAEGFDAPVTAMEYKIDYPAGMTWIEDIGLPPVTIGRTAEGIAQAWTMPVEAGSPAVVAKVLVRWTPVNDSPCEIAVVPHPATGFLRATVAPDHRCVEATGRTSYGGASDGSSQVGSLPVLYGANPNPFSQFDSVTQIRYWVPKREHVRLSVYDIAGRLIETLVDEVRTPGEHTARWGADDLPNGVYLCQLEVGEFTESKKVMILK